MKFLIATLALTLVSSLSLGDTTTTTTTTKKTHRHVATSDDVGDAGSSSYTTRSSSSAILGMGGKISLSPTTGLFLEADYNRGLTNVISTSEISINNIGFGFTTGVSIEI